MPTYDYECKACGFRFEKFQSITARSIRKCPECSKLSVHRLIGAGAGIIFKGSGFYKTDYRSDAYRKDAEKDKPPESKSESGGAASDKKADTKPAKPDEKKSQSDTK